MATIRVRSLRKAYGTTEALKGVSFDIDKGEIIGFLGPNGAGKTTTMKILTCFMAANSGEAKVAGLDCSTDSQAIRQKIGYLPENNPLYMDMSVFDYLKYIAELHNVPKDQIRSRIKDTVVDCSLEDKLHNAIGTLSKGYKQRVGLAATLLHDPEILILDEPTVGLDPNQIVEIRHLIKELSKKKTVIICSHNLAEVELTCNRIIIINKGKIVATGTPGELRGSVEGHANLRLTVKGDKKDVTNVLRGVDGVREVSAYSVREKGASGYELVTYKNRDLREKVIKAVMDHEFTLLEIHKESVSLEEIFNQVTKSKTLI